MTDTDQSTSDADSQTESVTPIKSIVYDEVGDLTIRVGRRLYPHRVDSKSLSRSSPVFKKMLFGGFVESRPSNEKDWVVDLPEDERHSMRIVFRIMHGAFKKVPTKLPLEDLYDLLAHTEKYDATHLLRPWAKDWVKAVKDQTQEPELLCVAWELGDSHLFRQMMVIIINKCHVNGRGNVVYGRQTRGFNFRYPISGKMCLNPPTFSFEWLEHIKPPNIEDIILSNRKKLVAAQLKPCVGLYTLSKVKRCKNHREAAWKCDSMVLGSLIKSLKNAGIDITNPVAVDEYRGSVIDLRLVLEDAQIASCSQCEKPIKKVLDEGWEKAKKLTAEIALMPDGYKEYLESQARKTGF